MPYLAFIFFIALSLLAVLFLLALSRWWSPSAVERDITRSEISLTLHIYRPLLFVLIGDTVLLQSCAWAVHFKTGLPECRVHLNEMGIIALVVFAGLLYLWRKRGADERGRDY